MLSNLLILGLICAYLMDATTALNSNSLFQFDEKLSTDERLELIGLGLLKLSMTLISLTIILGTAVIELIKIQYKQYKENK